MTDLNVLAVNLPAALHPLSVSGVEFTALDNARAVKKALKRTPGLAAVFFGVDRDTAPEARASAALIRDGLNNSTTRLVALVHPDSLDQCESLLAECGFDGFLSTAGLTPERITAVLKAELRTYGGFVAREARRETEVAILTTLGRLARADAGEQESMDEMLAILTEATGAEAAQVYRSQDGAPWQLVAAAFEQRTLQLCVDREYPDHVSAGDAITGSVAIPLLCYDEVVAVLHLFLGKSSLDSLTVEFVELLGKVASQLRILFERRAAEAELETQYERVKQTLQTLESTQMQLYQSEKLASVGQLAAGIAHEINNPIAFLAGNIGPLEDYTGAMATMLELHQGFIEQIDAATPALLQEKGEMLREKADELDIAFVMEDVRALVDDSRNGLKRVSDIVENLTRFARKDSMELTCASLEAGMDDTLRLLHKQVPHGIEIAVNYAEVPEVTCNHGMINQVFLNLVKNAVQAVGEVGKIEIRSSELDVHCGEALVPGVRTSVQDDGPGIAEENRSRLFEPFFTTKAPGEGTGLGLSMCYDIVDRHGGKLHFETELGAGTCFMLDLPLVVSLPTEAAA